MSTLTEMHLATESERADIFRSTYDFWGIPGLTREEHVASRMASVQHNRANWYVGCFAGRTVASMAAYPLEFRRRGQLDSGIAIGSVFTIPEFRGHNFATQLLDQVERREMEQGAALSLLFSDIAPEFYARSGYQECPSWSGWIDVNDAVSHQPQSDSRLQPFSPSEHRGDLARLYDNCHAEFEISIARNEAYWNFMLSKQPDDSFYWLQDESGRETGYLRVGEQEGRLTLYDWALTPQPGHMQSFVNALIRAAESRSAKIVGGWLPDCPEVRDAVPLERRSKELTMLKPLRAELGLDEGVLRAAQHFREIDHV